MVSKTAALLVLALVAAQGYALHQGCANQAMCTEANTYCSPGGFCSCKAGFTEIKVSIWGYCIQIPNDLGGLCSADDHCSKEAGCTKDNKCQCLDDYVTSLDGTQCLSYAAHVGEQCRAPEVCDRLGHSECLSETCVCSVGHVPSSGRDSCLKMAVKVTDKCEDSVQCSSFLGEGSVCAQGRCYCDFGFGPNQGRNGCLPVVHAVGGICQENGQCTAGLGHAKCTTAGTCKCLQGFLPNEDNDECV